jgi:hypothetical protein
VIVSFILCNIHEANLFAEGVKVEIKALRAEILELIEANKL